MVLDPYVYVLYFMIVFLNVPSRCRLGLGTIQEFAVRTAEKVQRPVPQFHVIATLSLGTLGYGFFGEIYDPFEATPYGLRLKLLELQFPILYLDATVVSKHVNADWKHLRSDCSCHCAQL